jgi:hypothetical protein
MTLLLLARFVVLAALGLLSGYLLWISATSRE